MGKKFVSVIDTYLTQTRTNLIQKNTELKEQSRKSPFSFAV